MAVTPGDYGQDALQKGKPAAGAEFAANIDRVNYMPGPQTDGQGRITFPALIPGVTYGIGAPRSGKNGMVKRFSVKSGEQLDLGDVSLGSES